MEDKKIQKVISGDVMRKKPSITKKILDVFLPNDINNIGDYIVNDVIIPNIKCTICDSVDNLLGMGNKTPNNVIPLNTRKSYDRYYNGYRSDNTRPNKKTSQNTRYKYDEIIFNTRPQATKTLNYLRGIIEEYEAVSVADFFESVGLEEFSNYTDNKYGWSNLDDAKIVRERGGYIINFPRVEEID